MNLNIDIKFFIFLAAKKEKISIYISSINYFIKLIYFFQLKPSFKFKLILTQITLIMQIMAI